ncbi:MAG: hypothetical protein U1F83_13200 [Verrucomicrobiota bacterium]
MPIKFRFNRWWIVALLAVGLLPVWALFLARQDEPVYQGRRLGSWLRGHPREYIPAVLAVGTNALPYLLAELQATDSRASQLGERVLANVSMGPLWRTARDRRYHAGIGLQILDTNAVPALMGMIFSKPMQITEGDPSCSAAMALTFMGSEAVQKQIGDRLALALGSPDTVECRNGCLALSFWPVRRDDNVVSLVSLSRDTNATIRAAALRAIMMSAWREHLFLPAVVARLEDEQATARRLAVAILSNQGSNVVVALPALRAAYSDEVTRPNLRGDLGEGVWGTHSWSAQEIRWAIRDAIKAIDPSAPLPADPP